MKSTFSWSREGLAGGAGELRGGSALASGVKRLIKAGVAAGVEATGVLGWAGRGARRSLTILCYHRVLPQELKARYFVPDLVVTPEAFREHLGALRRWYEVLPLGRAVERWRRGEVGDRPLAAITFDDGYQDNHAWAAPVLDEFGLPATFFVITGLVGTEALPWYDALARAVEALWARGGPGRAAEQAPGGLLEAVEPGRRWDEAARVAVARAKALDPARRRDAVGRMVMAAGIAGAARPADRVMTWPQLRELVRAGHEVGSHSRSHELLTQLDDEALRTELAGSRTDLERGLGIPVRTLCYPNGDTDDRVARLAAAVGYAGGVTVRRGVNRPGADALMLRRRFIHEERLRGVLGPASRRLLKAELTGVADCVFLREGRSSWGKHDRTSSSGPASRS